MNDEHDSVRIERDRGEVAGPDPAIDPLQVFLEEGRAVRDFEAESGSVRVETRVRLDGRIWSSRSHVEENGTELLDGPFAPLHEELDSDELEPEYVDDARRDFAGRALAHQLERCRLVERALFGPPEAARSNRRAAAAWVVAAAAIAVLALAALTVHRSRHRVVGAAADAVSHGAQTEDTAENPTPPALPRWAEPHPGSALSPPSISLPETGDDRSDGARSPRRPETSKAAAPPPLRAPAVADRTPARPEVPGAPPPRLSEPSDESAPRVAVPPPVGPSLLLRDLDPSHYALGTLLPGQPAFVDHPARLAELPREHLGCPLIQTSDADRDRQAGVSFVLAEPARLLVGHDRRLRKKPGWLRSFTATGETWQVTAADDAGDPAILDVFSRAYPPGPVELGANTEWTPALRKLRGVVPKTFAMYLVCLAPAD